MQRLRPRTWIGRRGTPCRRRSCSRASRPHRRCRTRRSCLNPSCDQCTYRRTRPGRNRIRCRHRTNNADPVPRIRCRRRRNCSRPSRGTRTPRRNIQRPHSTRNRSPLNADAVFVRPRRIALISALSAVVRVGGDVGAIVPAGNLIGAAAEIVPAAASQAAGVAAAGLTGPEHWSSCRPLRHLQNVLHRSCGGLGRGGGLCGRLCLPPARANSMPSGLSTVAVMAIPNRRNVSRRGSDWSDSDFENSSKSRDMG